MQAYGRLDMAFNNAGIQAPPTDAADEPAELFDRVNAINLRGVWTCTGFAALARASSWAWPCRSMAATPHAEAGANEAQAPVVK